ncbi:hypothetical protein LOK49_LG04G03718 [Camellia lanceoleosa]|uniref:Uncharacterized protein n=1 Tax=Camellia lanceoleosa TaxID=1840588 RepID=A0ACC0HXB7_9ERIC|nr:hypothetical protein LOK49_LG04G03718 [Camellia lanceoleosa]
MTELINSDINELKIAAKRLLNHATNLDGLGFSIGLLKWFASFAAMQLGTQGALTGVGLSIGYPTRGDGLHAGLVVISAARGGPANKAGILSGDVILKIDDTSIETIGTYDTAECSHEKNFYDLENDKEWKDDSGQNIGGKLVTTQSISKARAKRGELGILPIEVGFRLRASRCLFHFCSSPLMITDLEYK